MFGFSWSEIALIMVVALIAIGPKDLPAAIRTVTGLLRKARGMASEFQSHLDEIVREANLSDVSNEISRLRSFDLKRTIEKGLMPDRPSAAAAAASGFTNYTPPGEVAAAPITEPYSVDPAGTEPVTGDNPAPGSEPAGTDQTCVDAPAFIPPQLAAQAPKPSFIPPRVRRYGYH